MTLPRALVIEDAPDIAQLSVHLLKAEGYDVDLAIDGESGVVLARTAAPELVLLDLNLPDCDGLEVCRRIREFSDCYIIMVTGRTDEFDRVLGLSVGADDYVTKPFFPRELSARVRAIRRRPRSESASSARTYGGLVIDPLSREVQLDGKPLQLTRTEFEILDLLSSTPRRTLERQRLLDEIWGTEWLGADHIVHVHVGNLRRKLGEDSTRQGFIRTVRGVGYRFEPRGHEAG